VPGSIAVSAWFRGARGALFTRMVRYFDVCISCYFILFLRRLFRLPLAYTGFAPGLRSIRTELSADIENAGGSGKIAAYLHFQQIVWV
jgi:hypothetical protein